MKSFRGKILSIFLLMLLSVTVVGMIGCAKKGEEAAQTDQGEQQGETSDTATSSGDKSLEMVYVQWAEGIAMTNLCKVVLEDMMGYEVTIQSADVAPVYASLAQGDKDVFMDAWLPITHESYMEKYAGQLEDLGHNFNGAKIGLVVPSYVTINSIEELNSEQDKFDGKIVGIDSGAGIMKATDRAIEQYGLDLTLLPSSGAAMTASLKDAVDSEEWVVVTGWKPHWKFARWDLKFLEDPKGVYGAAENIHCIARKGFQEEMPEAATFFKNFMMNDQQLGSLMGAVKDAEDAEQGAREWLKVPENEALIKSWIPGA